MSSFSLATVAGVPAGLSIADYFHSNGAPFAVLGALSAAMLCLAIFVLPPQRRHLDHGSAIPAPYLIVKCRRSTCGDRCRCWSFRLTCVPTC